MSHHVGTAVFVMCVAFVLLAGTGRLDYFEPGTLERIDMVAVKPEIEAVLADAPVEFAAARETLARRAFGREREQLADRLEMAERLERYIRRRHADVGAGLVVKPGCVAKGLEPRQKMI